MQKIILVSYGEHEQLGNHIAENETGRRARMTALAERLKITLTPLSGQLGSSVCIASAEVPVAVEAARSIADVCGIQSTVSLPQLYVAEEAAKLPDPATVLAALRGLEQVYNHTYPVIIAVLPSDLAEALQAYIFSEVFGQPISSRDVLQFGPGEAFVIDWQSQDIQRIV